MEIKDIIRKSALELSIDSEKSDDVKQKNIETRTAVIGFIDMFIDRELYVTEQVIANTYLEEFPDDEDEEDTEEPSFEENIENINEHLAVVEILAKAREYLQARHEGINESLK